MILVSLCFDLYKRFFEIFCLWKKIKEILKLVFFYKYYVEFFDNVEVIMDCNKVIK